MVERSDGGSVIAFEPAEFRGDRLSDLTVRPFWLSEAPEFDEDPFWGTPVPAPGGAALFVSGPSRNGNHLIHSMLDGHPDLCALPGEDSFLNAFFDELVDDPRKAREQLQGPNNVDYILHLTGWGLNKWQSLSELAQGDGRTDIWSGIQPDGKGYVTDYQDTVVPVDYWRYEARLRAHGPSIRTAATLVEVVWLYMDALRELLPNQEGKAYPYGWVGSGMRREMAFLLARTPHIRCVAPIRPFESFYYSFAKGRFQTSEVRGDVLREAWEHWLHKTVDYLLLRKAYPDRVGLVTFNDTIDRPESTGRRICSFLGLRYHELLLTPTTAGHPTKGNSSYPMGEAARGTFYRAGLRRSTLPSEMLPPDYPRLWRIVEESVL